MNRAFEVQAAWRWYYLHLVTITTRVLCWCDAETAVQEAGAALFMRAAKGLGTPHGPHQYAQAMIDSFISRLGLWESTVQRHEWNEAFTPLVLREIDVVISLLEDVYVLCAASSMTPDFRAQVAAVITWYHPIEDRFTDGFTHQVDRSLIAALLARAEASLDDPDEPAGDWIRSAQVYADGERHRHLGWSQESKSQTGEAHGQQEAPVRDPGIPDPEGTDDQVAR